jgi:glycosyltransferase involved in cell wall biosynthesis
MRPTVSIIIPCRNEVRFIGSCLDSVLNNGFPLEQLEILVIDGMSDDGTRGIIEDYAARYPFIRLIDNVKKVTPYAINIGIRAAQGAILMRLDAHTICDRNYIAQCIRVVNNYGADDVGGTLRITARDNTLIGRSIVKALTLKFGVGNLKYRFSQPDEPEIVDTVAFFCCKREVFEKVGLFNEKLTRIQDMEFKRRLARAGGKIMLAPGAFADYQARSDFKSFWKHNWADGLWTVLAFAHAELVPVRPRHLAPACLVATLLAAALLGVFVPIFGWAFFGIAGLYSVVAFLLSLRIAFEEREWRFAFLVPFTIATMHGMRGFGSLWGVIRLLTERRLGHAFRLVLNEQSA